MIITRKCYSIGGGKGVLHRWFCIATSLSWLCLHVAQTGLGVNAPNPDSMCTESRLSVYCEQLCVDVIVLNLN